MEEFRIGDEVEVWISASFGDSSCPQSSPIPAIFISKIDGAAYPYICIHGELEIERFKSGRQFLYSSWRHCRKKRPDLKINDPVYVWNDDFNRPTRRLFAGWHGSGLIMCYRHGCNSWTSDAGYETWENWRSPTQDELKLYRKRGD